MLGCLIKINFITYNFLRITATIKLLKQHVALSDIAEEIRNECVRFMKTLAPGATFFVSQLIDVLMANEDVISLRIYEKGSATFKQDDPAPTYDTAWRTGSTYITIIPAVEDN